MSNFVKFGSIDQLRHFIKDMKHHGKEVVNLTGTVKIHGTNAGIGYDIESKELFVQSRNNIITVESDNAGFAAYVEKNKQFFKEQLERLAQELSADSGVKSIILYGEWAGGNIQKGVAVCEVEKFFAPFELKYVKHDHSYNLGNVSDFYNSEIRCFPVTVFPKYHVKLDLNNVEEAQQQIVDLTLKVEECCPVGEFFGVKGVGEQVIRKQYQQWLEYIGRRTYVPNENAPKCIIVDIDGTVAEMNGRKPFEWNKVDTDLPRQFVIDIVTGYANKHNCNIVFLSGRDGCCYDKTRDWLDKYIGNDVQWILSMRAEKDNRKDSIVKEEIFWNIVAPNYNVLGVFDDRPQVLQMWHELKLPNVICVGNPFISF